MMISHRDSLVRRTKDSCLSQAIRVFRTGGTGVAVIALLVCTLPGFAANPRGIAAVAVEPRFFNPSLEQSVTLSIRVSSEGVLKGLVVDRDGYVVRHLGSRSIAKAGDATLVWDGRNDEGLVVPDEAYSFKLEFTSGSDTETYFPAETAADFFSVSSDSYDRQGGTLRYTLAEASRVHIQAGFAKIDPSTGKRTGPVLKTIANREPRASGAVLESWSGYDESGSIYVPDLPDFVIAIAATSVPENAVITVGNRHQSFHDTVPHRKGASLISPARHSHHHGGLATLDDTSPSLIAAPIGASWSDRSRAWVNVGSRISLGLRLEGLSAEHFARHSGRVMVFIGQEKVVELPAEPGLRRLDFRLPDGVRGDAIVAVNWVSDHGPVAVSTFRVRTTR